MRHQKLVFAAFLGLFATISCYGQVAELPAGFNDRSFEARAKKGDQPEMPQVIGRITDFAGRSIRTAEITLFCLDADEVIRVKSNAFGYYQAAGLTKGHSYLISVSHRRYLFLFGSESFVVGDETLQYDFQGEAAR